jgi:hypothetical protein
MYECRYVVAAVAERLRRDLLDDLSAELQAKFGPIPTEALEETIKTWPNFEGD